MTAFINHFTFEFFTALRNKTLLLMNYMLPLGFHIMMGLMMASTNPFFLDTMIPAMVMFAILSGMLLGLPHPMVEAREAGIFRSYKINGVPAFSILAIPAISGLIHAFLVSIIIVVTGALLFEAPVPENWLMFFVVFLMMTLTSAALGLLIGVISTNSRVTVLWTQLLYIPSMMISGMFAPSALFPEALIRAGRLLPATYAMDAFNGLSMGYNVPYNPLWALLILLAGGLISFGLALYLFRWDGKNNEGPSLLLALLVMVPFILGAILLPLPEPMVLI